MNEQEARKNDEHINQTFINERREWNKLTDELYLRIDDLTAQLESVSRQKEEAIDTLAATLEARQKEEAIDTEIILDLNAEIKQLKEENAIYLKALVQMGNGWEDLNQAIKAIKAITAAIYTD